jgi:hypothetical protein
MKLNPLTYNCYLFTSGNNIKIIHIFATECIYALRMIRRISCVCFPKQQVFCKGEKGGGYLVFKYFTTLNSDHRISFLIIVSSLPYSTPS